MKIYIPYENYRRDFLSRFLLGIELLEKKKCEEVQIGWFKNIFFNCFKDTINNLSKKVAIIDSNNFTYKYDLIKFFKFFDLNYYVIDEEEIGMLYVVDDKVNQHRFATEEFFELIDSKFKFSKQILELEKNYYNKDFSRKLIDSGNPRIQLLKQIRLAGTNFKKKFIFIALPESCLYYSKLLFQLKSKKIIFSNRPDKSISEVEPRYKYVKEIIRLTKKLSKEFPEYNFLVRPHPVDAEFLGKYKFIFKNNKNVKISIEDDTKFLLLESIMTICGFDFVALESHLLGTNGIVYKGNLEDYFEDYKKHFSRNLPNFQYLKEFDEIRDYIQNKKFFKKNTIISDELKNKLNLDKNINDIVCDNINLSKKSNSVFKKIVIFFSKRLFNKIEIYNKNIKEISFKDYLDFISYKNKLNNIVLIMLFGKNFLSCVFKTILFIKNKEDSISRKIGLDQTIDEKPLNSLVNLLKRKKIKYIIEENNFVITIRNE